MITLQCTQKLLKEVKPVPQGAVIPTIPLGCWHANLLHIDRRKCVLFTNDKTRFSFLVPGLRKPDFQMLDEVFRQRLFKCLLAENIEPEQIEKVLDEIRDIAFTKTSSRSVLGSMNEIAFHIEHWIYDEGGLLNTDISELNMNINRMPSGVLGYKFSIEALKEALAE